MGAQHAEAVVEILSEHLQPPAEPDVPHLFLDALCAPEFEQSPPPRRRRRQSPALPLVGTRLDMERQLVGQVLLEPRTPEERGEPEAQVRPHVVTPRPAASRAPRPVLCD